MIIFQVFVTFFAFLMIYIVLDQTRRRVLSPFEARIWLVLWLGFIVLAFFPGLLQGLVHELNVSSVFDFLLVVSLMIIVYVLFSQRALIMKLSKQVEELVRREALDNSKPPQP